MNIEKALKKEIKKNYPEIIKNGLKRIRENVFIGRSPAGKYAVKVYKHNDIGKITNEHEVLGIINPVIPESIRYISRIDGKTYGFCAEIGKYYGIYEYINGKNPLLFRNFPLWQVKETARILKENHNQCFFLKPSAGIICRSIRREFKNNIRNLIEITKIFGKKRMLSKQEKAVKVILSRKIRQICGENFVDDLRLIESSSSGITHGDFSPPNLVFNNKKVCGILDWEHVCVSSYVWEIFRSMCFCANDSHLSTICTSLNKKKMSVFLESYFKQNDILTEADINALKLMPKYHFFLESHILSDYFLYGNEKYGQLISDKVKDHFWLENNRNYLAETIEKFANK